MSLLVLMYHRARAGRHGNPSEMLDAHFGHLSHSYSNVLPGDPLSRDTLNVCLSFDDGYFDFYATVFPLLKKHNLRALLAVPPSFVQERTTATRDERLQMESDDAFAHPERGGFCTWPELEEMAASGHVSVAAHGFTHCRLDLPSAALASEIDAPRSILGARLAQPVESFVFPFGRYSSRSLLHARRNYRFVFRIGGAINTTWESRVLYRVDADSMESPWTLFSPARQAAYRARFFWNRLRSR